MTIETEAQLMALREIGRIVADCLQFMGSKIEPGMTTKELDDLGADYLAAHGAESAPKLTYDFPGATCISINHDIAHGIPGPRQVKAGDMVNIDVSAVKNGLFADTGGSFIVPPETKIKRQLCNATREALAAAMAAVRAGQPLNVIGAAIEDIATRRKLSIIRNLGSHGVGAALHEEPRFIPAYFDRKDKRVLKENMVITIEPFLSTGATEVVEGDDGWTLSTDKRFLSAQYEHTMVITKGYPIVITQPSN